MRDNKKFPLNTRDDPNAKGLKKVFDKFKQFLDNYLQEYRDWDYNVVSDGGTSVSFNIFYKIVSNQSEV